MLLIALGGYSLFCLSVINTQQSEPQTQRRPALNSQCHQGHNHGSYRTSFTQTKASDKLPGMIVSAAKSVSKELTSKNIQINILKYPFGVYL